MVAQLVGVCSSDYECTMFTAAFLLSFFGAFRIGELVSPSKKVQGGIGIQEVACGKDVLLYFRRSKTDQMGKGRLVQVSQCRVRLCAQWKRLRDLWVSAKGGVPCWCISMGFRYHVINLWPYLENV